jgi:type I restriction enzyme M protein
MPDQLFYNTGISTYIWILSNKKSANRKGKVQLINATGTKDEETGQNPNRFWQKMPRSLGNKRKEIPENGDTKGIGFITKFMANLQKVNSGKFIRKNFSLLACNGEQPCATKRQNVRDKTATQNPMPICAIMKIFRFCGWRGANGNIEQTHGDIVETHGRASLRAQTIQEYLTGGVNPMYPMPGLMNRKPKPVTKSILPKISTNSKNCVRGRIRADILALEDVTIELEKTECLTNGKIRKI